jgi:hypothetical protein
MGVINRLPLGVVQSIMFGVGKTVYEKRKNETEDAKKEN